MYFLKFSLIFAALVFLTHCGPKVSNQEISPDQSGVFGGKVVTSSDLFSKHVVGIIDETMQAQCTGTLIAPDMILTAAHCMSPETKVITLVFVSPQTKGWSVYRVQAHSFIQHENYDERNIASKQFFDIGLIHFRGELPLEFSPVILDHQFSRFVDKGVSFTAAGFGVSNRVFQSGAGKLRTVQVPMFQLRGSTEFETKQFKRGICSGDSGGPLFAYESGQYIQVGVASRASKLLMDCLGLAIYTRVDAYQNWISEASERLRQLK